MAKNKDKKKKKGSKKDDVSEDILDVAALSIKKFRKVTKEISRLSTGQKLVGGIALVAAGLAYLATQEQADGQGEEASEAKEDASPLLLHSHHGSRAADDEATEAEAPAKPHHKARKPKARPKPSPES